MINNDHSRLLHGLYPAAFHPDRRESSQTCIISRGSKSAADSQPEDADPRKGQNAEEHAVRCPQMSDRERGVNMHQECDIYQY